MDIRSYWSGLTAHELFSGAAGIGLTYDDLLILPRFVDKIPESVDLRSDLGGGIRPLPIISSPMDRVTEWRTAVHMALNGCLGILHINLTPEQAAAQVRQVKRFQMGFIFDPVCGHRDQTLQFARRVKVERGFSTIPITEDGTPGSPLVGLVTKSCWDFESGDRKLGEVMIPHEELWTFPKSEVTTLAKAKSLFRTRPQLSKLLIVNPNGSLWALVNRDDVRGRQYPDALTDDNSQLLVGAAVTTHPDDDERVRLLIEAGVDCLVVDSSQGGTGYMVERLKKIREISPDIPVIAGNTVTLEQSGKLITAGASAIRVGMGPGSICTTRGVLGIGGAQGSAVYEMSQCGLPIIADGGIRGTGDMLKALALGASFVMVGRYIAGCDETPSPFVNRDGKRFKLYRGMGSVGAMRERGGGRYGSDEDTLQVAQGTDDRPIPAIGPLDRHLAETLAALRLGLRQLGCSSVAELHKAVASGEMRFQRVTEATKVESGLHDL